MSKSQTTPVKILTPYRRITQEAWPGEEPVEFLYADDTAGVIAKIHQADVLLSLQFTPEMGAAANGLKLIHCAGIGTDKIHMPSVPAGCLVANVFEHEQPIAEWVLMSMIALDRQLLKTDRTFRAGSWEMSPWRGVLFPELKGRTLGVVGLGRIGQKTADFARCFGMRLLAATRTVPTAAEAQARGFEAIYGMDDLDIVLKESDFVLLSLPLTATTENLIGKRELNLMKPDACLINVARAEVIVEEALFTALESQQIKGAALDVWYNEPLAAADSPQPSNCPFWELDNVIMSPHASSITTGMLARRVGFIAQNIDRFARGEQVENIVR